MKRKYSKAQGPKRQKESEPVDLRGDRATAGEEAFWGDDERSDSPALREDFINGKPYDLEERTAQFGEAIIQFAKSIPQNPVNNRLIGQLVGAATSVGANYCEADEGVSRKDYKKSIGTCKKEAKESKFFLRMVATAEESMKPEARRLWREAKELHLIFCSLYRK